MTSKRPASFVCLVVGTTLSLLLATAAFGQRPAAVQADLALSMTRSPDSVPTGAIVTHSISVSNLGPSAATGVKVLDTFGMNPSGWIMAISAAPEQGSCTTGDQIACTIGSLGSGETVGIVVKLQPRTEGTLTNTASVSGQQKDVSTANNSASTSTEVYDCSPSTQNRTGCPSVEMSDTPDPVRAGEVVIYDVEADPEYVYTDLARLVMPLPEGTELVLTVGNTDWLNPCSYSNRVVTCSYFRTRPSASIALRVLKPGALTNTVHLYIHWGNHLVASATTVTQVGPPTTSGADTPAPVRDLVEQYSPVDCITPVDECLPTFSDLYFWLLKLLPSQGRDALWKEV